MRPTDDFSGIWITRAGRRAVVERHGKEYTGTVTQKNESKVSATWDLEGFAFVKKFDSQGQHISNTLDRDNDLIERVRDGVLAGNPVRRS